MGNSWFQFQQFKIHQDRCAMKISTDAILLGGMADFQNPTKILDIGTGTGVVSLMLAQRFPQASIVAVEVDDDAASQAYENFQQSPFSERLKLVHSKIQNLNGEKFDLIVSNPPYFSDHLKSADPKRIKALHTDELSFQDLLGKVAELLSPNGSFWVILPMRQMMDLEALAKEHSLLIQQSISIRDRKDTKVLRQVCEFSFAQGHTNSKELILKDDDGSYTFAYRGILGGFLLGY